MLYLGNYTQFTDRETEAWLFRDTCQTSVTTQNKTTASMLLLQGYEAQLTGRVKVSLASRQTTAWSDDGTGHRCTGAVGGKPSDQATSLL